MTLAWLAAAWVAGIAACAAFGDAAYALLAAVAVCAAAASVRAPSWRRPALALAVALAFAGGLARYAMARSAPAADDVRHYNGSSMRLRGVIDGEPTIADTSQRFTLRARQVQLAGAWRDASGGAQIRAPAWPRLHAGDVLEVEGRLDAPPALDRFDYAAYLDARGIGSVLEYPQIARTGHEGAPWWDDALRAARGRLARGLELALPEPEASLAQGVLLGRRSAVAQDVQDDLNATNTSHLVVVSGSNVVLVATWAMVALAWLIGRRRASLLAIAAVLAYAMLVGPSPPVVRATIMGVLLIVARLAGRPAHGLTSVLFAAALMCGADPRLVRDVSFQLSFAATAGIIWLARPLRIWTLEGIARATGREELPRWTGAVVAEPLAVTVAAVLATTPLLALHFGRVSLVSLPANMLVVPLFGAMVLACLAAALGGLMPHAHLVCAYPAHLLLAWWLALAAWFAGLPHAALSAGGYGDGWTAATYAALAALLLALGRRVRMPAGSRLAESRPFDLRALPLRPVLALSALFGATAVGVAAWPSHPHRLAVTVLDVGQGDAILIRAPGGRDVLIDGGPGRAVLRGLGDALPWDDRSIELMVLTHPNADHQAGLIDVLARYDVRSVLSGPAVERGAVPQAWAQAVADEGAPVQVARAGMSFDLGSGARLDVLGPDEAMAAADVNDTGVVLRLTYGDVRMLFTADIGADAERALLADGADLRADVLKVAHHGSATSSTARFLDAVRPRLALVSAGRDNPFGHPAPETVQRLQAYAAVYNTADHGALRIETDGRTLRLRTDR
ncbi:MAG TPA: ComEC/Rec2 family competence protein, partial [Dehalococcoidia bacterium]|nr:ComEC/Rec2 family competence protein [Dehalococcoidia bacterium]